MKRSGRRCRCGSSSGYVAYSNSEGKGNGTMTRLSFFGRIPAPAFANPLVIVAANLVAAIYGYSLEIDVIGLRFDKSPAPLAWRLQDDEDLA